MSNTPPPHATWRRIIPEADVEQQRDGKHRFAHSNFILPCPWPRSASSAIVRVISRLCCSDVRRGGRHATRLPSDQGVLFYQPLGNRSSSEDRYSRRSRGIRRPPESTCPRIQIHRLTPAAVPFRPPDAGRRSEHRGSLLPRQHKRTGLKPGSVQHGLSATHPMMSELDLARRRHSRRWLASQLCQCGDSRSKVAFPVDMPSA